MPIILRVKNLSTDLGITNGSQGFVRKNFTKKCSLGLIYAESVYVEFPQSKVKLSDLPARWFAITPAQWSFTTLLKQPDDSEEKVKISRLQLPIQPAFAITGHSAQGKTLHKVLVDLSEGGSAAYVAASRAQTREGLFISKPVTLQQINKRLPYDLVSEIRRLEALEHNTYVRYGMFPGNEITVPDPEAEQRGFTTLKGDLGNTLNKSTHYTRERKNKRKHDNMGDSPLKTNRNRPDDMNCGSIHPQKRSKFANPSQGEQPKVAVSSNAELGFPSPPTVGCRWSSVDWSCAYDSVFMALLYIYQDNNESRKLHSKSVSQLSSFLFGLYDRLLTSEAGLRSADRFDACRDEFRDRLSLEEPHIFPRAGHVGASVTEILDRLFPPSSRMISRLTMCTNERCMVNTHQSSHASLNHLDGNFPSECTSLNWDNSTECFPRNITLQDWVDQWAHTYGMHFMSSIAEDQLSSACEGIITERVCLTTAPPVLFFQLIPAVPVTANQTIAVSVLHNAKASYILKAIVYLSEYHFTIRMYSSDVVWNYDGRINGGRPYAESDHRDRERSALTPDEHGSTHVYIYGLRD